MNREVIQCRCPWAGSDPRMLEYHDSEWGVEEHRPKVVFERLILETMQAGLSWSTVLNKREAMRLAFFGFDFERIASLSALSDTDWLNNGALIRHAGKLEAMIRNANLFLNQSDSVDWIWTFVDGEPIVNSWRDSSEIPAYTAESERLALGLSAKGYRFIGPTVCYAFMQSIGMVNDHLVSCFRHKECMAS